MTSENIKEQNWDVFNEKCKNGKIYIIKNNLDNNFLYIGSTYNELDVRFNQHKQKTEGLGHFMFNYVRKFYLNNWDSFYIELLFDFPCKTIRELRNKETETILKLKPYNHPSTIELYSYKKCGHNYDTDYDKKNIIKTHKKILNDMDYDNDNNILCPFCKTKFKFYNINNHLYSQAHNLFSLDIL